MRLQFAFGDVAAMGRQGSLVVAPGSDPLSCFSVSVRDVPGELFS